MLRAAGEWDVVEECGSHFEGNLDVWIQRVTGDGVTAWEGNGLLVHHGSRVSVLPVGPLPGDSSSILLTKGPDATRGCLTTFEAVTVGGEGSLDRHAFDVEVTGFAPSTPVGEPQSVAAFDGTSLFVATLDEDGNLSVARHGVDGSRWDGQPIVVGASCPPQRKLKSAHADGRGGFFVLWVEPPAWRAPEMGDGPMLVVEHIDADGTPTLTLQR